MECGLVCTGRSPQAQLDALACLGLGPFVTRRVTRSAASPTPLIGSLPLEWMAKMPVPETYESREKLVIEIPGQRLVSNVQNQADHTYIVIERRT